MVPSLQNHWADSFHKCSFGTDWLPSKHFGPTIGTQKQGQSILTTSYWLCSIPKPYAFLRQNLKDFQPTPVTQHQRQDFQDGSPPIQLVKN